MSVSHLEFLMPVKQHLHAHPAKGLSDVCVNVFRCQPSMESIEVEDWDTGQTIRLKLDPL